jgi:hypothetical protein
MIDYEDLDTPTWLRERRAALMGTYSKFSHDVFVKGHEDSFDRWIMSQIWPNRNWLWNHFAVCEIPPPKRPSDEEMSLRYWAMYEMHRQELRRDRANCFPIR